MDVIDAIRERKSIRGFCPDLVPEQVLKEILEIATRAPSTMNTQPWEVTVVSGEVLDKIRQGNLEKLASRAEPDRDVELKPFEGIYRQRQVELAVQIFGLMGIAREDREKRAQWMQRGFCFFDAPAAIIISMNRSLSEPYAMLDIGCLTQTICLVALKYGLGTCIEDQGIMFSDVVRRFTGIPESKRIVIGIAIGYPDWDFPANRLGSKREPIESVITWCGP